MSTPIKIAELEQLDAATARGWSLTGYVGHCGDRTVHRISPQFTDRGGMTEESARVAVAARNALPALLRLARASDRYAWMLSKDGPGEDEEHVVEAIVAEWKAARAAFDFTTEEAPS